MFSFSSRGKWLAEEVPLLESCGLTKALALFSHFSLSLSLSLYSYFISRSMFIRYVFIWFSSNPVCSDSRISLRPEGAPAWIPIPCFVQEPGRDIDKVIQHRLARRKWYLLHQLPNYTRHSEWLILLHCPRCANYTRLQWALRCHEFHNGGPLWRALQSPLLLT